MAEVTIYKITNTVNGKVYIGSSLTPELRKQTHLKALKGCSHYNKLLQQDYTRQAGIGFLYSILDVCEDFDRNIVELAYINMYDAFSNGYNIGIPSGTAGSVASTLQLETIPYIKDSRFTAGTNLAYSYLFEMYKLHKAKELPLYLRIDNISRGTGLSDATVKRALRELRRAKLLNTVVDKCFNINLYIVNPK